MAWNFPDAPVLDEEFIPVVGGPTYKWDGTAWQALVEAAAGPPGPAGPAGADGADGAVGPPGPEGVWVQLTQAEYDLLAPPDPAILYIVVG